jgi:hypothetical protein
VLPGACDGVALMKLGELRAATADLPDDTELVVHPGDGDYYEMNLVYRLPPVLEHSWTLAFVEGAPVNADFDMDARVDAELL